jgi:DNA-binding Xre family transcriptional regulator
VAATLTNTATNLMVQAKFVDDSTIEVMAPDGEKFTWNTFFPVPTNDQEYYAEKLDFYFQKYFEEARGMSLGYWICIKMNYDVGLGIFGGRGDREDERIFIHQERVRIGTRIRELRKEKNIDARNLAQNAKIDAANLSRIEQGRYSVGLDILSRIAFAIGARIELVDFVVPKNSDYDGQRESI